MGTSINFPTVSKSLTKILVKFLKRHPAHAVAKCDSHTFAYSLAHARVKQSLVVGRASPYSSEKHVHSSGLAASDWILV